MRTLGIDPGIERCGWGIVQADGSRLTAVDYGCIVTPRNQDLAARLVVIYDQLTEIVDRHNPDLVAVEELFFAKNARTAIDVGQARGVCLLVAGRRGLPVEQVTPDQVKSSVVGYGNATKDQVGAMIKDILGLARVPRPDDVCDALAVAVTAFIKRSFRVRITGASGAGRSGKDTGHDIRT